MLWFSLMNLLFYKKRVLGVVKMFKSSNRLWTLLSSSVIAALGLGRLRPPNLDIISCVYDLMRNVLLG